MAKLRQSGVLSIRVPCGVPRRFIPLLAVYVVGNVRAMGRMGDFVDVHVTRAHKIVALIVGVIALIGSVIAGAAWVYGKFESDHKAHSEEWQARVTTDAAPDTWGPDRQVYKSNDRPEVSAINSVIDSSNYGDERNFMRIRDLDEGTDWSDTAMIRTGGKYEVAVYFRNDSSSQSAKYPYLRVEIPAIVRSRTDRDQEPVASVALAYVRSSNTMPAEVYDSVTFVNDTRADAALRYVKGTAKLETDDNRVRDDISMDALISESGIGVGSDRIDGDLPPGFSGRVSFTLIADQPGFLFENSVKLRGSDQWASKLEVKNGDVVEYRLAYDNTGTTEQTDVVMKAVWPSSLRYLDGSSELSNSNNPAGAKLEDGISGDGVNIGHYMAGANAYLYVSAIVQAPPCSSIPFAASVETVNGNMQSTAVVSVSGEGCTGS